MTSEETKRQILKKIHVRHTSSSPDHQPTMRDHHENGVTRSGDGSPQMQSDDHFVQPAQQDVGLPSSSSGLWPHQMVRHALQLASQVATTNLGLNAPMSPSSSIYSPSGCKYSRLGTRGHAHESDADDSFESAEIDSSNDGDDRDTTAEEIVSTCTDTTKRQQFSLNDDDDQNMMNHHRFSQDASPFSWRTLAVVAALAMSMNVAYLAGYQSYAHKSAKQVQEDGNANNQLSDNDSNPLYPYPNYPKHYRPAPGTGRFKNGRTYPKVFVCITGQLPRLELANKIDNLFTPWVHKFDAEFDVALVLTDTNHTSVQRIEERDQSYYTVEEVYEELSALKGVNVLNSNTDVQSQNPVLNPHYIQQRAQDTTMAAAQVLERVQNHVRQFESLAECHHHMSQGGTPSEYDLVHRIREDSGYYQAVDFVHIYDVLSAHPMTILSSDCQFHGGINDRGSFVSPDAAFDYFVYPILDMYTRPLPSDVRNTEQFLMVTYAHSCRLVQTDSFQIFRLWEKVDNDPGEGNNDSGDNAIASSKGVDDTAKDQHISTMEFSRSDLRCLEDVGRANVNHFSTVKRAKFCHDYSDGYNYCVFFDKAGISYYPGKPGLLREYKDDLPSARINENWVPPDKADIDGGDSSSLFDILNIGWEGSAVEQVDQMLKMKTNEETIAEKKAKRKKKRQDWEDKHKRGDDQDDDNTDS